MKKLSADFQPLAVCVVLFFGTLLLFSRALENDFIDLDDPDYVSQNSRVQNGLSGENFNWAFTSTTAGNWHPLTWLSLMLDAGLYGNSPRGFHSTSVFLHALNAMLAFLALRRLTGAFWPGAICAAIFAWHPLRVESVAWVAERKDVLSGFFFFLTLLAYAVYAEKSKIQNSKAKVFYGVTILFFALGLMSKPMLVTVPFLLLLFDFWPLRRFNGSTIQRLLIEKTPLFLLSLISCGVTFLIQKNSGAVVESQAIDQRFANAIVSVARYLGKFFRPQNLAVAYPLPNHWPAAIVIAAGLLIFSLTAMAILQLRRRPWLFVGWLWFVGMLVPVIGIVQVGLQAMADRYTYLPMLGFAIALVWTLREIKFPVALVPVSTAAFLIVCVAQTRNQISYWKNSSTLYQHALAVTKNNYLAESNLGTTLFNARDFPDAESHFRRAIESKSDFATARFKLAVVLEVLGRPDEALTAYENFLKLRPRNALAHYNAGVLLLDQNQFVSAAAHFQAAIENQNDYAAAFAGLAVAEMRLNQPDEAIIHLRQARKLDPNLPDVAETLSQLEKKNETGR